jgi:ribosome-binding protein aMBF1 (putative translation factor)
MKRKAKPKDGLDILISEFIGDDPKRLAAMAKHRQNFEVAMEIFDLRQKAGLTQKQLADKIGTKQSVISRLEDADYRGHSLEMLRRIAEALNCRLEVHITPEHPFACAH